jgi:hypothetical protein
MKDWKQKIGLSAFTELSSPQLSEEEIITEIAMNFV